jgi:hypothetical protein
MSPAGAGVAAYRRVLDWSRTRRIAGHAILAPVFVYLCVITAVLVVGTALSVGFILFYGFSHRPILTGAILVGWLLVGSISFYVEEHR